MEKKLNAIFNVFLLIILSVSIGPRKGIAIFLIVSIMLDPLMQRFVIWKTIKSGMIFWLTSIILLELMLGAFGIHVKGIFMYLVFFASFIGAYRFHKSSAFSNLYEGSPRNMGGYDDPYDSREDFYTPNTSHDDLDDYKSATAQYQEPASKDEYRPL
ncbi:hypothetical protein [Peptoniphilus sp.]|uniref:hypothetical protein n=1 Tax=Peptoniphilus sp. TaxID=1971214 RepID=UPI003990F4EA